MAKSTKSAKSQLAQLLDSHAHTLRETAQMLDEPVAGSLQKVDWAQVLKLGEEVSKQATVAGMLWSEDTTSFKELNENMKAYCNCLQGFLLLTHGSMVGAGHTLSKCIRESAKRVNDCSLTLLTKAVSYYGSKDDKNSIPQFVGLVWEACSALKKTPISNHMAVGRAMTKVAVSVKDVLREMNELKSEPVTTSADQDIGSGSEPTIMESESHENDAFSEDEIGNDLSTEEMTIARLVINIISSALAIIKELIRFVSSLSKLPSDSITPEFVEFLEGLLEVCQKIGGDVDEMGACVYPPQEVSLMKTTAEALSNRAEKIKLLVLRVEATTAEGLFQACESLQVAVTELVSEMSRLDVDVEDDLQKLSLSANTS